ncbi:hypothetical protein MMC15_004505 [Xylographa vitiligo]|nr:hypothetical protein [Xylographa vitiligo]
MASKSRVFFLDLGMSNMKDNMLAGRIMSCNGDGSDLKPLVEGIGTAPDGLGIDLDNKHIYYTNMGMPSTDSGFISRVDMNGMNDTVIIPQGITWTPKQLTLEPTTKQLYWSDREGMRVFRANFDGSNVEMLVRAGQGDADRKDARNWCVGIAVDIKRGRIYWTQKGPSKGNQGRLFTADINLPEGETPDNRSDKKILLDHLPEPIDLDLDAEENVLYLTDRGDPPFGNTVSSIDLNNPAKIQKRTLVKKLHEAIGLALDVENKQMYVTDLLGGLYRANMDGSEEKVLFPDLGDLTGVAVIAAGPPRCSSSACNDDLCVH